MQHATANSNSNTPFILHRQDYANPVHLLALATEFSTLKMLWKIFSSNNHITKTQQCNNEGNDNDDTTINRWRRQQQWQQQQQWKKQQSDGYLDTLSYLERQKHNYRPTTGVGLQQALCMGLHLLVVSLCRWKTLLKGAAVALLGAYPSSLGDDGGLFCCCIPSLSGCNSKTIHHHHSLVEICSSLGYYGSFLLGFPT